MKRYMFLGAVVLAMSSFAGGANDAQAQGIHFGSGRVHVDIGNPHGGWYGGAYNRHYGGGHRQHSYYRGGHGGHYGGNHYWHDTSHYDYHPGGFQRHYDHYDYVPGHYDYHQTGHWHHDHH